MSSAIDPEDHRDAVGTTQTDRIGTITRRDARRYARAVEDDHPLFTDVEHARKRGYDDIVVPPNFLSAIIGRGTGGPAGTLREDGVDPGVLPIDLPETATLLGGGQDLTFHRYVTAGETITVEETFAGISQKESSKMGTLTFLERHMEFVDGNGDPVVECDETFIVGDRP